MKLTGTLAVMSLPDLLQWIAYSSKTGRLTIARGSVSRTIYCREGRIVACTSDDPSVLLGQFLLCHGDISEETLQEALKHQEETGVNLGTILVQMEALSEEQLTQIVASKAMETIHGIFDWQDASFEFVLDEALPDGRIEVDLGIQETLLEGARRWDEMEEVRKIFPTPNTILARTDVPPDPKSLATVVSRSVFELIDGQRTLAEILLASHASEFTVYQLLLRLSRDGSIAVWGESESAADGKTSQLDLDRARQLIDRHEFQEGIGILRPLAEANPNEESIKSLLASAEAQFVVHLYEGGMHPDYVPVCRGDRSTLPQGQLTAQELHLLDRIDGKTSIKSIMWVVPMRPVDVLGKFKMMLDRGLIELIPCEEHEVEPVG